MRLSSRGRNDSLKKLDPSVIERSYSRRGGGSCNTGLRGLMVAGDSKADARNKQNTIDQRYTTRPFAVFKAIRRPCNFVKSRAFHRSLHQEARTHTLRNQIISEFRKCCDGDHTPATHRGSQRMGGVGGGGSPPRARHLNAWVVEEHCYFSK